MRVRFPPLFTTLFFLLISSGCSEPLPTLRVFTWSSYFDPSVVHQFEREYKCRVLLDIFDSNELMYAKLKSGREGYDLITPSIYIARLLAQQRMIQPLDWSKLENLDQLDPNYCLKKNYAPYCAPYLVSITGVGYLKSRVHVTDPSWAIFAEPQLRWRTTLLNDYRETIASALLYLGYDPNFCTYQQMQQALAVLLRWKTLIAKFENEQYKLGLDSAEFLVVQAYNGDIVQLMMDNPAVDFFLPKEGFTYSVDVFCMHEACRQRELAHAFINFMHRPEIAAKNTTHTCYLCPNLASYERLPKKLLENSAIFVPPEEMKRAHLLVDVGEEGNQLFLEAWDKLRSQ